MNIYLSLVIFCISTALTTKITNNSTFIKGVNLGGMLLIEEWMFSFNMFDRVAELPDTPQGVVMPPLLPDGFGENWYSEGDLVNKLVNKYGENFTIEVITAHRDSYITDDDITAMQTVGIDSVRIPVGYWAFIEESQYDMPVIITDPGHSNRKFVTITHQYLTEFISKFIDAGISVLIDIHAYPGGSSDGSYNGVYPEDPIFFGDYDLMGQGIDIVTSLCNYYLSLPLALQRGIHGITIMNEPAQALWQFSESMQGWMRSAVDVYRYSVAEVSEVVPKLYMNFIENSISTPDIIAWMLDEFTSDELNTWAVLDIHSYYAWNPAVTGCYADAACSYYCAESASSAGRDFISGIINGQGYHSHDLYTTSGIPQIACSEFSLATFDQSRMACRSEYILDRMFDAQRLGFPSQGLIGSYFWTWRMPFGGSHEAGWSLKHYLGLECH